jgi:hypothetical protein
MHVISKYTSLTPTYVLVVTLVMTLAVSSRDMAHKYSVFGAEEAALVYCLFLRWQVTSV